MYLFKLQPFNLDQHNWQAPDAFVVTSPNETGKFYDDSDKESWQPFAAYGVSSTVKRGQYVYYSAKDNNVDDPFNNWVGRLPEGKNTWIRGRCLHDYDCINMISPGATQRSGILSIILYPKKMIQEIEVSQFYNDSLENYLILTGLRGASVNLSFYDSATVLLQEKTITSAENLAVNTRIVKDKSSFSEPELAAFLLDTTIVLIPLYTSKIMINIAPSAIGSISKVSGIFIGHAYKIAKTDSSGISLGAVDYSRITYNPWGKIGVEPGKKAKSMQVSLPVTHDLAQREEKILRLLQSCRATPTIFHSVNSIVLDTFISSLTMIYGLVKSSAINEDHYNRRTLDIEIDGIPVDYNP